MCPELFLVAHLLSWHSGDFTYNNRNWGAGVECRNGNLSYSAGAYRNSFYKPAVYAGVAYEPLHVGPVAAGIVVGLASGYEGKNDLAPLIGGLRVRVSLPGGFEAALMGIPPVDETDAVIHLTVGWRFW